MWQTFCESERIEVLFKNQIVPFRTTLLKGKIKQRFPKSYLIYIFNHKKTKGHNQLIACVLILEGGWGK